MEKHKALSWSVAETTPGAIEKTDTVYYVAKRVMDVTLVSFSLLFILPLMLLVAVLVKLDSPGAAIFRQQRVGAKRRLRGNRIEWEETPFTIFKFRTMKSDAKSTLHRQFIEAYIAGDQRKMVEIQQARHQKLEEEAQYKLSHDPRVTKVGRFLRKTSLDELPQLFNVLRGDMSLVGPRPPIPYEVELYLHHHRQRLQTIPGITGLWQVKGRSATSFEEMVHMDVEYIQQRSLWLDTKLIFGTVTAVVNGKGAR